MTVDSNRLSKFAPPATDASWPVHVVTGPNGKTQRCSYMVNRPYAGKIKHEAPAYSSAARVLNLGLP